MSEDDALAQGREAFRGRAWHEAFRQLQEADRRTPLDPEDLERLATAAYLAGLDAESEAAWTRAHQQFLERSDRERAARCAFWLAFGLFHRGASAPGAGWTARAARLIEEAHGDSVLAGYLLVPQAIRSIGEGDAAAGYSLFTQAAAIAERFHDRDLAALACHGRGRALIRQGQIVDGVALLDEAMAAVVADDVSPTLAGDIYCSVLEACSEMFDLRRAREWTMSLSRWCGAQPGLVRYRGECLTYRAEIAQLDGSWRSAIDDAEQACERLRSPLLPAIGAAYYRLGEIHRLRGEFAKADDAYRQAGQSGRRPQPGLSLLRFAQGEIEPARAGLRAVLDETKESRVRARLLPAFVEISLAAHDVDAASAAAQELSEIATAFGAPVLSAAAAHATGAVRLAERDARGALTILRDACGAWRELGMPYDEAQTRVVIALASDAVGDTDTRDFELDAARQVFQRLGAGPALTRLTEIAHPRAPRNANGLSEREVQVLQLVAAGKTNRSIADDLFISEKTVARHVSNIFNKLGVSSRAAATAYAYQRHIV